MCLLLKDLKHYVLNGRMVFGKCIFFYGLCSLTDFPARLHPCCFFSSIPFICISAMLLKMLVFWGKLRRLQNSNVIEMSVTLRWTKSRVKNTSEQSTLLTDLWKSNVYPYNFWTVKEMKKQTTLNGLRLAPLQMLPFKTIVSRKELLNEWMLFILVITLDFLAIKLLRENIWFEDVTISLSLKCYVPKLSCQPQCSHLCLLGQIRAQYSCGSANIYF